MNDSEIEISKKKPAKSAGNKWSGTPMRVKLTKRVKHTIRIKGDVLKLVCSIE